MSHADPIKAIVATALGMPLDLLQRTVVSTCSVTVLMLGDDAPMVLCVNSTAERRAGAVMIHRLEHPDHVAVGAIGDVGERLFLLQAREGRRLVVVKFEKDQVAILASWLARVVRSMARPEALEMDVQLEPEYEIDLVAGEITVALDEEAATIDVSIESAEDEAATRASSP